MSTIHRSPNISPSVLISGKENDALITSRNPNSSKAVTACRSKSTPETSFKTTPTTATKPSSRTFSLLQPVPFQQHHHQQQQQQLDRTPLQSLKTKNHQDGSYSNSDVAGGTGGNSSTKMSKRSPLLDIQTPQMRPTKASTMAAGSASSSCALPPRSISSSQRKQRSHQHYAHRGNGLTPSVPSKSTPLPSSGLFPSSSSPSSSSSPHVSLRVDYHKSKQHIESSPHPFDSVGSSKILDYSRTNNQPHRREQDDKKYNEDNNNNIQQLQKHSKGERRRVLLFGEKMESLFCIDDDSFVADDDDNVDMSGIGSSSQNVEIVKLARSIVDGTNANDPSTWRRVLDMVLHKHELQNQQKRPIASTLIGITTTRTTNDILRLHRRATMWFPLDELSESASTQEDPVAKTPDRGIDIMFIWLSFARVQEMVGSIDDARRTYQFMENQTLPRCHAVFYLQYAEFERRQEQRVPKLSKGEGETPTAVLRRGIREDAKPVSDLQTALKEYEGTDRPMLESSRTRPTGVEGVIPTRVRFAMSNVEERKEVDVRKRPSLFDKVQSPKRQKVDGTPNILHRTSSQAYSPAQVKSTDGSYSSSRTNQDVAAVRAAIPPKTTGRRFESALTLKSRSLRASSSPMKMMESKTNMPGTKRPSLTSRLSCKGLSGRAKRVDAEQSFLSLGDDDDDDDDDDDYDELVNVNDDTGNLLTASLKPDLLQSGPVSMADKVSTKRKEEKAKPAVPRFNKSNLSYMWEWDPSQRLKKHEEQTQQPTESGDLSSSTNGESSHSSHSATQNTQDIPAKSGVEKKDRSGQVDNGKSTVKKEESVHHNEKGTKAESIAGVIPSSTDGGAKIEAEKSKTNPNIPTKSNEAVKSNPSRPLNATNSVVDHQKKVGEREKAIQLKKQALLDKANFEFLPLVNENNILHVNGAAYAKLGVIGKGGSSKVYRALSKKCSVVGIKKVKLDGMDKRAIEGYANEISLLKRLKGNPAIIQMYDSQVDLKRKSIFVVMELGEVDLAHVLKQRALSETSRSLNLNFIRLTWQQMLSAVHCIHEERIIHSDLKPANFLFVRGALKLIDFGIAKAITSDNTTSIYRENQIGTLNYMSPEAILDTGSGEDGPQIKIGRASDVWSLGCILYEMVYGRTPFASLQFIQKLQAITNPKHTISFPEDGNAAAVDAMKLCLKRDPEERPPIVGPGGLLNEHSFLHSNGRNHPKGKFQL